MEIVVYHKEKQNSSLLPTPLRCLIVGTSGSGKTNLLLNFIYNKDGVQFAYLYVFSRSLEQTAYKKLCQHFEELERVVKKKTAYFFAKCDELIPLDDCHPNSLVVFDDCLMEDQSKIKDYFIRGRHKRISCIYLSQSYSRVDMQVIRNNINFLCVFNQNRHYAQKIFSDFVGSDMTFCQFIELCKKCWDETHGFISIDMTKKSNEGKYKYLLSRPLLNTKTL